MELFYDDSKDLSEGEIIEIDGDIQNQVALILPRFRKKYGYKFAGAPDMFEALNLIWNDLCENGRITEPTEQVLKQALAKGGKDKIPF